MNRIIQLQEATRLLNQFTLQEINIDPGSFRGWKTSFHYKLVIFRVYVNLPGGNPESIRIMLPHDV